MKKTYVLGVFLFIAMGFLQAQTQTIEPVQVYFESDFSNGLEGWGNINNGDPDHPGWGIGSNPTDGNFASHSNISGNYDDRLISPAFDVESDICRVEFEEATGDGAYSGEHAFYIGEYTDGVLGPLTKIKEFDYSTNQNRNFVEFDFNGYQGKRISLAFVNKGNPGLSWSIFEVQVYQPQDHALELLSFERQGLYLAGKNQRFLVEVQNRGIATETEVEVEIAIGSEYTRTKMVSIDPLEVKKVSFDDFILSSPFQAEAVAKILIDPIVQTETKTIEGGEIPEASSVGYAVFAERNVDYTTNRVLLSQYDFTNFPTSTVVTSDWSIGGARFPEFVSVIGDYAFVYLSYGDDSDLPGLFADLDLISNELTLIGDIADRLLSMAYNPVDQMIYAIAYHFGDPSSISFVKIDPQNGNVEVLKTKALPLEDEVIPYKIAIDRNGTKYVLGLDNIIYFLNEAEFAVGEQVVDSPLNGSAEFISLSFDNRVNTLYTANSRNDDAEYIFQKYNLETGGAIELESYDRDLSFFSLSFPNDFGGNTLNLRILKSGVPLANTAIFNAGLIGVTNDEGRFSFHFLEEGTHEFEVVLDDDIKIFNIVMSGEDRDLDVDLATLGISETLDNSGIEIMPNPASHYIQVSGMDLSEAILIIYDSQGKQLKQFIYDANKIQRINIEDLTKGLYFVNFKNAKVNYTQKLMVE